MIEHGRKNRFLTGIPVTIQILSGLSAHELLFRLFFAQLKFMRTMSAYCLFERRKERKLLDYPRNIPLVCSGKNARKKSARLLIGEKIGLPDRARKEWKLSWWRPVLENWKNHFSALSTPCVTQRCILKHVHPMRKRHNSKPSSIQRTPNISSATYLHSLVAANTKKCFRCSARSPIAIGNSLAIINADCRATLHRINRRGYQGLYQ